MKMPHRTHVKLTLPRVIGHRGACAYAPENTLASLRMAHEIGLLWVEVDVMLSKDEALIVIHDETLNRTTNGHGLVRNHTLNEIKQVDAGTWFDKRFAGEKIPTLSEVIQCCRELNLGLNIELKAHPGDEAVLAKKVVDEVCALWSTKWSPILLSSFSLEILKLIKINPFYFRAWNLEAWVDEWRGYDFYSLHFPKDVLNKARVERLHKAGFCVLAYTVNQSDEAKALFEMGVDAVFSDKGDKLLV